MEEDREGKNTPLFPLLASSQLPPEPQPWLQNPSFTAALPAPRPPAVLPARASDDDEEPRPRRREYDLVTSPSSSGSEAERRRRAMRRKERRKRRGKRTREGSEDEGESRRPGVRVWAGSRGDAKDDKDCYFDARGDPDNLAFGSIYRMDVARYKRQNLSELHEVLSWYRWKPQISPLNEDGDNNGLDGVLRMGGRYYSARYSNLERDKNFKQVKVAIKESLMFTEEFIPFLETQRLSGGVGITGEEHLEKSWEDEVILRTREFNKLLRESPNNESAWIAFAEFQDKIASTQRQKAARLQSLEKKIRILEKAVELNPESEPLLLTLLKSYERRDSGEVLVTRWEKILTKHYGSYKLWKEFLLAVQGDFSRFKVSEVRRRYAHAVQALSSYCSRLCRQGHPPYKSEQDPDLVRLELDLVDIFLSLCRLEWQTGFQELATGLLQAQIEYSLFAPSLQLASQSRLRLFEHFWNSGGARVGEDGAVGWSTWIDMEEEYREKVVQDSSELETYSGGWTGWFTPSSREETDKDNVKTVDNDEDTENVKEDLEVEEAEQEDDIEALLKKLGVNVDVDHQTEIKDTDTWNRWSTEEAQRDHSQWMPVRESSDGNDADQLTRSILFEDVCNYLFPLSSEEARLCLMSRFIDFYGGKISHWTCTNDSSWVTNTLTLDTIPGSVSENLQDACLSLIKVDGSTNDVCTDVLLGGSGNSRMQADMIRFMRNSLILCLNVFPRNYILEEALLVSEELLISQTGQSSLVTPCQALAKQLLKNDRQNLLLSGLYARREAAYGNINRARKVFDMALSLMCDLPSDLKENIPLLYLWYAEMEMDNDNADQSSLRAIHILSCLGGNAQYSPFNEPTSSLLLLRAHNGFREQLKYVQSTWCRGCITDSSIAIVRSASMFEILTRGCTAGIQVIEEALSKALPERRCQSQQLESLSVYYINLLRKYANKLKLQVVWGKILQQLQTYPFSPKVLSAVVEVGCFFTVPQKIRFVLDKYYQRNPSVPITLFALLFELGRPCSEHRIRVLFERALANDQLQKSAILWRCYLAFEFHTAGNISGARRIFFRAIHTCPWSKKLWLDGFQKLSSVLTANELSDLHEVMRDKELNLRTDIYEILLQDEFTA